jgi:hypothetical protein
MPAKKERESDTGGRKRERKNTGKKERKKEYLSEIPLVTFAAGRSLGV